MTGATTCGQPQHTPTRTAPQTMKVQTMDIDERILTTGGSLKTGVATTENVVRLAPGPASVPTFDETGTVTREVAENTAPGGTSALRWRPWGPKLWFTHWRGPTQSTLTSVRSG